MAKTLARVKILMVHTGEAEIKGLWQNHLLRVDT
jgi:hypothetical protein